MKNEWSGLVATVDGIHDNAKVTQRPDSQQANQRFDMPEFFG
jgi:hypothetical protein